MDSVWRRGKIWRTGGKLQRIILTFAGSALPASGTSLPDACSPVGISSLRSSLNVTTHKLNI